jgi:hypothetical protein
MEITLTVTEFALGATLWTLIVFITGVALTLPHR